MKMFRYKVLILSLIFIQNFANAQFANIAPTLTATGDQIFCPGSPIKIVTDFNIIDPDDTGIDELFIQISTNYVAGTDLLQLTGNHTTISSSWDIASGKLTLSRITATQPTYFEFIEAVKQIEFSSSATNPTGEKKFSITVGQANFLPLTGHYYKYEPNLGITWSAAKSFAQTTTYYGLQGYLVTITSQEEAQIAGEQSSGAGWIGGSDEQQEGVWKWMTGPENGTVFWNGLASGSSPTFANWNSGEPNSLGNENYAHITAPGVGSLGSWNDLSNSGEASGNYQPKGYIVEFGGLPGDPILQIATSTTITIPEITISNSYSSCGTSSFILTATTSVGTINWYENPTGGIPIATGDSFTTPVLNANKTYYLDAFPINCTTANRTQLVVTVNEIPTLSGTNPNPICEGFSVLLTASPSIGIINWYENASGGTSIASGTTFMTPLLYDDKYFYAEANNNGCLSISRIAYLISVKKLPEINDEFYEICPNETITLDAGIPNFSYLWSNGAISQTIQSTGLLNYSVLITSPDLCSKTKNFSITYSEIPKISEVLINETTATIITENEGNFEYSIDGIRFQTSNIFTIPDGGIYIAYTRDLLECLTDSKEFLFIKTPPFFSPNNDSINDIWIIAGLEKYVKAEISIYDKYGKLLEILSSQNTSWNGTFNNQKLPASDYWYVLKIDDLNLVRKGHFSLIR
jgi:gliding motility-associated-like protein